MVLCYGGYRGRSYLKQRERDKKVAYALQMANGGNGTPIHTNSTPIGIASPSSPNFNIVIIEATKQKQSVRQCKKEPWGNSHIKVMGILSEN